MPNNVIKLYEDYLLTTLHWKEFDVNSLKFTHVGAYIHLNFIFGIDDILDRH